MFDNNIFKTADNTHIDITLRKTSRQSRGLIVQIPGLPGSKNAPQLRETAPFYLKSGFDCLSLSFYETWPNSRQLENITIDQMAQDLSELICFLKDQYQALYITAYSFGALPVLVAYKKLKGRHQASTIDGLAFHEASFNLAQSWHQFIEVRDKRYLFLKDQERILIGHQLYEEVQHYNPAKCMELARNVTCPSLFILADQGYYSKLTNYYPIAMRQTHKMIVGPATHSLYEEGILQEVGLRTGLWVDYQMNQMQAGLKKAS